MTLSFVVWGGLLAAFVLLAIVMTFVVGARMNKRYENRRVARESQADVRHCTTCGSFMEFHGLKTFAEAAGGKMDLELYRCGTCRKVEMFLPPAEVGN